VCTDLEVFVGEFSINPHQLGTINALFISLCVSEDLFSAVCALH